MMRALHAFLRDQFQASSRAGKVVASAALVAMLSRASLAAAVETPNPATTERWVAAITPALRDTLSTRPGSASFPANPGSVESAALILLPQVFQKTASLSVFLAMPESARVAAVERAAFEVGADGDRAVAAAELPIRRSLQDVNFGSSLAARKVERLERVVQSLRRTHGPFLSEESQATLSGLEHAISGARLKVEASFIHRLAESRARMNFDESIPLTDLPFVPLGDGWIVADRSPWTTRATFEQLAAARLREISKSQPGPVKQLMIRQLIGATLRPDSRAKIADELTRDWREIPRAELEKTRRPRVSRLTQKLQAALSAEETRVRDRLRDSIERFDKFRTVGEAPSPERIAAVASYFESLFDGYQADPGLIAAWLARKPRPGDYPTLKEAQAALAQSKQQNAQDGRSWSRVGRVSIAVGALSTAFAAFVLEYPPLILGFVVLLLVIIQRLSKFERIGRALNQVTLARSEQAVTDLLSDAGMANKTPSTMIGGYGQQLLGIAGTPTEGRATFGPARSWLEPLLPVPITIKGTLAKVVAIGGETTGIVVKAKNGDYYELDLSANPEWLATANKLDGKPVRIEGTLVTQPGIETTMRRIITVSRLDAAGG